MISTQLAVVGGGPGGYAAAFLAADMGLDVSLIDPEPNPGGVCVYRGCIPSKALLHVAQVIADSRHAAAWGVAFGEPTIDLEKLLPLPRSRSCRAADQAVPDSWSSIERSATSKAWRRSSIDIVCA